MGIPIPVRQCLLMNIDPVDVLPYGARPSTDIVMATNYTCYLHRFFEAIDGLKMLEVQAPFNFQKAIKI